MPDTSLSKAVPMDAAVAMTPFDRRTTVSEEQASTVRAAATSKPPRYNRDAISPPKMPTLGTKECDEAKAKWHTIYSMLGGPDVGGAQDIKTLAPGLGKQRVPWADSSEDEANQGDVDGAHDGGTLAPGLDDLDDQTVPWEVADVELGVDLDDVEQSLASKLTNDPNVLAVFANKLSDGKPIASSDLMQAKNNQDQRRALQCLCLVLLLIGIAVCVPLLVSGLVGTFGASLYVMAYPVAIFFCLVVAAWLVDIAKRLYGLWVDRNHRVYSEQANLVSAASGDKENLRAIKRDHASQVRQEYFSDNMANILVSLGLYDGDSTHQGTSLKYLHDRQRNAHVSDMAYYSDLLLAYVRFKEKAENEAIAQAAGQPAVNEELAEKEKDMDQCMLPVLAHLALRQGDALSGVFVDYSQDISRSFADLLSVIDLDADFSKKILEHQEEWLYAAGLPQLEKSTEMSRGTVLDGWLSAPQEKAKLQSYRRYAKPFFESLQAREKEVVKNIKKIDKRILGTPRSFVSVSQGRGAVSSCPVSSGQIDIFFSSNEEVRACLQQAFDSLLGGLVDRRDHYELWFCCYKLMKDEDQAKALYIMLLSGDKGLEEVLQENVLQAGVRFSFNLDNKASALPSDDIGALSRSGWRDSPSLRSEKKYLLSALQALYKENRVWPMAAGMPRDGSTIKAVGMPTTIGVQSPILSLSSKEGRYFTDLNNQHKGNALKMVVFLLALLVACVVLCYIIPAPVLLGSVAAMLAKQTTLAAIGLSAASLYVLGSVLYEMFLQPLSQKKLKLRYMSDPWWKVFKDGQDVADSDIPCAKAYAGFVRDVRDEKKALDRRVDKIAMLLMVVVFVVLCIVLHYVSVPMLAGSLGLLMMTQVYLMTLSLAALIVLLCGQALDRFVVKPWVHKRYVLNHDVVDGKQWQKYHRCFDRMVQAKDPDPASRAAPPLFLLKHCRDMVGSQYDKRSITTLHMGRTAFIAYALLYAMRVAYTRGCIQNKKDNGLMDHLEGALISYVSYVYPDSSKHPEMFKLILAVSDQVQMLYIGLENTHHNSFLTTLRAVLASRLSAHPKPPSTSSANHRAAQKAIKAKQAVPKPIAANNTFDSPTSRLQHGVSADAQAGMLGAAIQPRPSVSRVKLWNSPVGGGHCEGLESDDSDAIDPLSCFDPPSCLLSASTQDARNPTSPPRVRPRISLTRFSEGLAFSSDSDSDGSDGVEPALQGDEPSLANIAIALGVASQSEGQSAQVPNQSPNDSDVGSMALRAQGGLSFFPNVEGGEPLYDEMHASPDARGGRVPHCGHVPEHDHDDANVNANANGSPSLNI